MKAHPLAELFPMLEEAGLQELAWDIRTNGLLEPIVQLDGMILDGRNRFEACRRADVEPRFVAFAGSDPVAFVASKNLYRRQLTTSQRAMVAARILDIQVPPTRQNSADSGRASKEARATRRVAEVAGVGHATIERARTVLQNGAPELVKAVDDGALRVTRAAELARRPVEEQLAALAQPAPKAQRRPASVAAAPVADDDSLALARDVEEALARARELADRALAHPRARGFVLNALEDLERWMRHVRREHAA